MSILSLARRSINNPRNSFRHLIDMYKSMWQDAYFPGYRKWHSIPHQRPRINKLTNSDEFVLVILDACRYDIFKQQYSDYLNGELSKTWGSGRWTAEYVQQTWKDQNNVTYLSSIPVISDFYFELMGMGYRPSDHISKIIPLWDTDWEPELGTVPPEPVTNAALAVAAQPSPTRIVAHYAQPHAPYIGDTQILPWKNPSEEDLRKRLEEDLARPSPHLYTQIQKGEISDESLYEAYVDNIRYVLDEVVRLIERVDCSVVVTADHGEHLGENGRYLHYEDSILIRQVPWMEIDEKMTNQVEIESKYENWGLEAAQSQTTDEVQSRLTDLGYIES